MKFTQKISEKLRQFMIGRYGVDTMSKTLIWVAIVCYIIGVFTKKGLFSWVGIILLFYIYFRMFSKNIYKRAAENQMFVGKTAGIRTWFYNRKNEIKARKTHHIYRCPNCKQKIRVPKGKGRISIHCPKCDNDFIKNS